MNTVLYRVSNKTDPKQLATSIIYSIESGNIVKVGCIGESAKVLMKALGMITVFGKDFYFKPDLDSQKVGEDGKFQTIMVCYVSNSKI